MRYIKGFLILSVMILTMISTSSAMHSVESIEAEFMDDMWFSGLTEGVRHYPTATFNVIAEETGHIIRHTDKEHIEFVFFEFESPFLRLLSGLNQIALAKTSAKKPYDEPITAKLSNELVVKYAIAANSELKLSDITFEFFIPEKMISILPREVRTIDNNIYDENVSKYVSVYDVVLSLYDFPLAGGKADYKVAIIITFQDQKRQYEFDFSEID